MKKTSLNQQELYDARIWQNQHLAEYHKDDENQNFVRFYFTALYGSGIGISTIISCETCEQSGKHFNHDVTDYSVW